MLVTDFNFRLPEDLIAQTPPVLRGSSRMLRVDRTTGAFTDDVFTSLPHHLRQGDLLILNDSRVLPARLFAQRIGLTTQTKSPAPSGRIEVLLTEEREPHIWTSLVRPAKKVQQGETLAFPDETGAVALTAEVLATGDFGERTLRFSPNPNFLATLDRIGHMPLPPYIHREKSEPDTPDDKLRYQTVYAAQPGSAAAPTAGLHFTPEILNQLRENGVEVRTLTLHVGLGTFQPVRAERLADIRLHTEHYTLPADTAQAIQSAHREGRRILAAGTTTTRTLEHCATTNNLEPHSGSTSIFLSPGYRFRIVSGLLTNFHLPQSTLLMLISAFLAPRAGRPRRGPAARPRRLRPRRPRALPLLLLRRLHVDLVKQRRGRPARAAVTA